MMYGDWYEHQGHPHHHHIHGDMEPAFVVRPGDDCCPDPTAQQCECVTSGDIEKWNNAADTIGSLTGIDLTAAAEALTSIEEIKNSAENWNSTYETVCANSGNWVTVDEFSGYASATNDNTAMIDETVATLSSELNRIEDSIPHLFFDTAHYGGSITGDGSSSTPYGVKDWESYKNLRNDVNDIYSHLLQIPSADGHGIQFITDGAAGNLEKHENSINEILYDVAGIHGTLSSHMELIIDALNGRLTSADLNRYVGSDTISVFPYPGETGNTYAITIKDLPAEYKKKIGHGEEAYRRVADIEAKSYVEFIATKRPKSKSDLAELTGSDKIYYC